MTYDLKFKAPARAVSINETNGLHWSRKNRLVDPWKEAGRWYAVAARLKNVGPMVVTVTIPFTTGRRRDPHNYTGTVVKALIDGMVRAGVWPDDNPEFVTVAEPILTVDRSLAVIVHLESRTS